METREIIIFISAYVLLSIIIAIISFFKGRNPIGWFLLSLVITPLFSCVIVHLPGLKKREKLQQFKDERELAAKKMTSKDLEKVLDAFEKQEGEDSISYLARCMREAENETDKS